MLKLFFQCAIMYAAVSADLSDINTCYNDPASLQLPFYKERTRTPLKCLTAACGARVNERDLDVLNDQNLLRNRFFIESLTHRMRERIPERHVHPKGAGAFGYFEVTHDITQYCKAKLFSKIGKRTPLVVRFSHSNLDKGESDTTMDSRGFATKFYTEDGNFDIVGFNTPIFTFKDPFLFQPAVGNVFRRNPVTNLKDENMLWDFIFNRPESLSFFMFLLGVTGIQDGYVCMTGFSIHTYQVYNDRGESYFVRWHKIPDCPTKRLSAEEAAAIASIDPDYYVRQLYNAIADGKYPTYTLGIQVLTKEEMDATPEFDFFDVTKFWPVSKYPVMPIGKIVLNRNPKNFFADMEQVAFSPANFPDGILGAPDNLFTTRMLAYRETQAHRLGANFDRIPVNCPATQVNSYERDGVPPVDDNGRDGPNYLFNSFRGPSPCKENNKPELITITQIDDSYNFDQITDIYKNMSLNQKNIMVKAIVSSLKKVYSDLQTRVVNLLGSIDPDLKFRVTIELSISSENCIS